jgi:hypothetical protein
MLKIEAARKTKRPIPGDPRAAEFRDSDDEEEGDVAAEKPKMLEDEVGDPVLEAFPNPRVTLPPLVTLCSGRWFQLFPRGV